MGKSSKIIRRSINAFFQNYNSFTSAAALLVFPVSTSILLSQALIPSSSPVLHTIHSRLQSLFEAAGFPASSQFFSLLNLKLSQTIFSFVFTLPFTFTFLTLAKASVIQILRESPHHRQAPPPLSSLLHLYRSLLQTHFFNSFVILSANAAVFSLLFLTFNAVDVLGLSSSNSLLVLSVAGTILYSIVLANTMVVCNLATIVSVMENCGGWHPLLKACVLIRGRTGTALTLALPANLGMAAAEALFQYRVMKPYHMSSRFNASVIWEFFSISYIYSLLVVFDIIVSYMFFKSCKLSNWSSLENKDDYNTELKLEDKGVIQV